MNVIFAILLEKKVRLQGLQTKNEVFMKQKIFYFLAVLILSLKSVIAIADPFAYVTSKGGPGVEVIDTLTNTTLTTVPVGGCIFIAMSPDGKYVYVDTSANNIDVIETATNNVIASIPVGTGTNGIAVSLDGTFLYVTDGPTNSVLVIDTATNSIITSFAVGTNPQGIVFHPSAALAYVMNSGSNNVSVVNTSTHSQTTTIGVGTSPLAGVSTPSGSFIYVTNTASANVSVINTATNTVSATIGIGTNPWFITITPDGNFVYTANQGTNDVSAISTASNSVIATIGVGNGPTGVAVTPDGTTLYVVNKPDNTISIIDVATNTVTSTLPTGVLDPVSIVITPLSITSQGSLSVTAKSKSDSFMTESDIYIQLSWSTPLEGIIPLHYKIYRDGILIATIAAGDTRTYKDHNRKKNKTYTYEIIAEDELGPLASTTTTIKAK